MRGEGVRKEEEREKGEREKRRKEGQQGSEMLTEEGER